MTHYTPKDIKRFWSKVSKAPHPKGCWEWQSCTNKPGGYGRIRINGKKILAHRISYEISYGEFLQELHVLHTCDNPPCCNPAHLFLGTDLDNMRDRDAKGRQHQPKGEINGRSKLTDDQILEIRKRYKRFSKDNNQCALAKEFGVVHQLIGLIVNRKIWTHI